MLCLPKYLLTAISLMFVAVVSSLPDMALAQQKAAEKQDGMQWRLIGPYRAGRVAAVAGVPGSTTHFYFGAVDGGVWETTNAGTVWTPLFDQQKVASIGALAVAPSDAKVVYAGTGESDIRSNLASGDGVYRSTDGGQSWVNAGLHDSRQISRIVIDPTDARVVYVGVLGDAYVPSDERGVYKSVDGGGNWKRVLNDGPSIGVSDLAIATKNPKVLFAGTWNAHRPPWSTYAPLEGDGSGIERSTDGGENWTKMTGHGLPGGRWGRVGVAVSADGRRVYAAVDDKEQSGIYRSDDGGDNWTLANKDPRLTSRAWYFNCITIDPQNPDVLYVPNVALYRTVDAGKTFTIVKGAPGGDDYHQLWVDPENTDHLLLGVDQGATISLDRGATWTTWYNQPTAQLYHVTTDDAFPYNVYGAQQDSGAIAVASRDRPWQYRCAGLVSAWVEREWIYRDRSARFECVFLVGNVWANCEVRPKDFVQPDGNAVAAWRIRCGDFKTEVSRSVDACTGVFSCGQGVAVPWDAICDEDRGWWIALGDDQSGLDGCCCGNGCDGTDDGGERSGARIWRCLYDCSVAARCEADLGGQRYGIDSPDARWGKELGRRDPEGSSCMGEDRGDRGFALRCGNSVCDGRCASVERQETVSLRDA